MTVFLFMRLRRSQLFRTCLAWITFLIALASPSAFPQNPSSTPARVQSVQLLTGTDGPFLEILTDSATSPVIQKLDDPPRLVVDLPNTVAPWQHKRISGHSDQIKDVRVEQHNDLIPICRIVIDLRSAIPYTSEAAGTRIDIRLNSDKNLSVSAESRDDQGSADASTQSRAGLPRSVTFSGSRVAAGSSISAGSDAATLRLGRGGELRVCPNTTVSVTSSSNGRDLLFGMSTGALEAHYSLQSSADAVLTPDFRILFAGPGDFDYAISVDDRGNTCVRTLAGNTASATVSELIGDGTYQVKASQQVLFHSGRLANSDDKVPANCGCAASSPQSVTRPETKPLPPNRQEDVHVTVDAPLVYRATDRSANEAAAKDGPSILETESLPVASSNRAAHLPDVVEPPQAPSAKPKRAKKNPGFFKKVKIIFGTLFGS